MVGRGSLPFQDTFGVGQFEKKPKVTKVTGNSQLKTCDALPGLLQSETWNWDVPGIVSKERFATGISPATPIPLYHIYIYAHIFELVNVARIQAYIFWCPVPLYHLKSTHASQFAVVAAVATGFCEKEVRCCFSFSNNHGSRKWPFWRLNSSSKALFSTSMNGGGRA